MQLNPIDIQCEHYSGKTASGLLYIDNPLERLEYLNETRSGQIKLIYIDPSNYAGEKTRARVRVGAKEWKSGKGSLEINIHEGIKDRQTYLAYIKDCLKLCASLLSVDGMLYFHTDFRMHPYYRLMLDEIFGEKNFMNEIIWTYQTGGKAMNCFGRKHDVILFYRKSAKYDFNIDAVMTIPDAPKNNHMRRHVDPDGRVYRSYRAGGRTYTYYDDEPVAPSDVWNDLGRTQQKDSDYFGYDSKKPIALMNRILLSASREGDWVLDPFCGSAAMAEAAKLNGRNFIGINAHPLSANIGVRRLKDTECDIIQKYNLTRVNACAEIEHCGGFCKIELKAFGDTLDNIDNWSLGYIHDGKFCAMSTFARTKRAPELKTVMDIPLYNERAAILIRDVYANAYCFELPLISE